MKYYNIAGFPWHESQVIKSQLPYELNQVQYIKCCIYEQLQHDTNHTVHTNQNYNNYETQKFKIHDIVTSINKMNTP